MTLDPPRREVDVSVTVPVSPSFEPAM